MYATPPTRGVAHVGDHDGHVGAAPASHGTGSNPAPRSHSESSILSTASGSRSATRRSGVSAGTVGADSMKCRHGEKRRNSVLVDLVTA